MSFESWITLIGIIASLLGLGGVAWPYIQKKRQIKRALFKPKDIMPDDIMGDRGKVEYGYRENSWCTRDIEKQLDDAINDTNSYVTVLTGHYASGKSRLVYHYLRSGNCPFSRVYAPNTSDTTIDDITSIVRHIDAKTTIIVFDDIDVLFANSATDDLGLTALFSIIHNKGIKTIVTLTDGTNHFDQFISNCNHGDYKGKKPQKKINHIRINEIERGDDCYLWCVAHLKNEGFSTVIGGYVSELSREIPESINSLTDEEKKALVTYYISTKFRRHDGREKRILLTLHNSLWNRAEQHIEEEDFNSALGHLVKIGFLKRQAKGRQGTSEYREYYVPSNRRLYDAFMARGAANQIQGDQRLNLHLYTANTPEAERLQIDGFLQKDPSNPILYSRVISHSLFDENINYIEKKLMDHLSSNGLERCIPEAFYQPIGDLIRRKSDGFEFAKKWISEGKIELNEHIISSLLVRPQEREEITKYLNEQELPVTDENATTVFYHSCKELISTEFDGDRATRAYNLYQQQSNDRYTRQNYSKFCECILNKANSIKRIESFWDLISTSGVELLLNRNAIKRYFIELSKGNNRGSKDQIIVQAYSSICEHWNSFSFIKSYADESEINLEAISTSMTKEAIKGCRQLQYVFEIYDIFCKNESISNDRTLNMVSYDIFDKANPLSEDDINTTRQLLINRLLATKEGGAAAFKMINKYLEKMTSLQMIIDESKKIKNECNWEGELIDRDTINVMLKVARTEIKKGIDINDVIDVINDLKRICEIQSDKNFVQSPIFKTEIYSCARELIKKGATQEQISTVLSYANINTINNRDALNENERLVFDISERARPASITDINEAIKLVTDCIGFIQDNEFIHPDIIANILLMYSISFRNYEDVSQRNQLQKKIEALIHEFDDKVQMPNTPYCSQVLYYNLQEHEIDIEKLKPFIDTRLKQLYDMGEDLDKANNDFFRIAIENNRVSVKDAFTLLTDAVTLGDKARRPREYRLKARLLTAFVHKIASLNNPPLNSDQKKNYMIRIQEIINKHQYLDYSEEAWRIVADVRNLQLGINFPITSLDRTTRHQTWDYYVTEQKTYMLDEGTISVFIKREKDDMVNGNNPNGQDYIDQANLELEARKPIDK